MRKIVLALPLALGMIAGTAAAQEESTVTMADVPPAVLAAAKAAGGGTEFSAVSLDDDNGTATYEFGGTRADGVKFEVDVLPDGTIEELEEGIAMDAVPEAVSRSLTKYFPDMKPDIVEKSTRTNFEVFYEFEGKGKDGQDLDIEVRADGKQILITDDLAG